MNKVSIILNIINNKVKFYEKRIKEYKEKRNNILEGKINCIPSPFKRFHGEFPGIEKAKYYGVTGNQKSGKSQLTDFLFVLHPLLYAFNNRDKVKVKIFYFSLEMSIQEKYDQFTCFWLYYKSKGQIRIDTKILNSLNSDNPISLEILDILDSEEYKNFFDFIEDNVIFEESIRNPYGIFKYCKEYAENNGKIVYKNVPWRNEITDEIEYKKQIDYYEYDDPLEYRIIITDHVGLLSPESRMDLRGTIGKFSSNDCVQLRNNYKYTIVAIQQQMASQESIDNIKIDRIMPTADGLADNKTTSRDFNVLLGIFSPFRFKKATWEGYSINDFKDNIRFLEVILNRSGSAGGVCPLFFDGACNIFAELPLPHDKEQLNEYKKLIK